MISLRHATIMVYNGNSNFWFLVTFSMKPKCFHPKVPRFQELLKAIQVANLKSQLLLPISSKSYASDNAVFLDGCFAPIHSLDVSTPR